MSRTRRVAAGLAVLVVSACGPRAHIPPRPEIVPGALAPSEAPALRQSKHREPISISTTTCRATARGKPAAITAPSSPLSFMYSLQVDKLGLPFALTAGMYGVPLPRPGDRRR